ncbi:MAG: hypothetical protein MMC33_010461 [Icmadophila ericetorum]|nr:hypothetical protein [Icmadophila ericetorum]
MSARNDVNSILYAAVGEARKQSIDVPAPPVEPTLIFLSDENNAISIPAKFFLWYSLPRAIQDVYADALTLYVETIKSYDKDWDTANGIWENDLETWTRALAKTTGIPRDRFPLYLSALEYSNIFRDGHCFAFDSVKASLPGNVTRDGLLLPESSAPLQAMAFQSFESSLSNG